MSYASPEKNILLVEDEAIIALSESISLKKYGYKVIHVLSGAKAIEVVNDSSFAVDLILMDINLHEKLDGTEIAKIILREHDIPILFLSSHIEREIVTKTENITSFGYVVKNSGITVLDASIKMAFRLHNAYQDLKQQKMKIETKEKELRLYEKRYRRLFESAKDGILILNAETGVIVDVNPYLIDMLGYSKAQFLDKNIWDISSFKNIDYSKQLYKALQDKEYVRYDNLPLETSEGKIIHVEFVSNVYLVDSEKVIQCNVRDITTRVNYEKILTDDIDNKQALLTEVQHRARNSFNLITNLIRLRAGLTASEATKTILEDLTLRVRSVSDLYSILYETDSFNEVHLRNYFNKVIKSTFNLSNAVTVKTQCDDIVISSKDAALIGMILVELLSNIIKHAYPDFNNGVAKVELKKIGSRIVLVVEDKGVGLQKDFDITQSRSLGFCLIDLMVHQLNGSINFRYGKGTEVTIEFPV